MKNTVKKIMPAKAVRIITRRIPRVKLSFSIKVVEVFSRTKFLSSVYYIFNPEFRRETHSVMKGKLEHLKSFQAETSNYYLLRRNIHRLEKGLLMSPRRDIFGTSFILETVKCFNYLKDLYPTDEQITWANDVLTEYFAVTVPQKDRDKAERLFQPLEEKTTNKKPYQRNGNTELRTSIEDLQVLAHHRRSVRWFQPGKVEQEKIDNAMQVAAQAPTACNRQPYYFKIIQNEELLKKAVDIPMGTKGFSHNINNLAIVIGDLSAYPFERDRHLIYIDSSLAVMSFLFALESQQVSSCVLNWPDIAIKEEEVKKQFNLKDSERVIMFIAFGYPNYDEKVAFSQKKELDRLRTFS